jgi:L-threo-3-deoxy-hexylosonate aldolase
MEFISCLGENQLMMTRLGIAGVSQTSFIQMSHSLLPSRLFGARARGDQIKSKAIPPISYLITKTRVLSHHISYLIIMAVTNTTISLRPGVYVATLTFFVGESETKTQTLDTQTLRSHISRLCKSGISGIVTLGSNGEAVHLSPEERRLVTVTTREVLDLEGHTDMPVIVGCSAQSTQQTITLCRDAAQAGGSHVLVLPPSYYKAAMTPKTILAFYHAVADASPLPVIVYSFPPVVNGLDMSSDLIIQISQHPNVVGTKFTCGDTGKLARVARAMNTSRTSTSPTPTPGGGQYWAFGGLADFTLQALVAGGAGVIAGGANLAPKAVVKVYESFKQGKLKEAMELQALLAEGDWVHTVAGIGGTKAVLQHHFSYGGVPRLPLTGPSADTIDALMQGTSELMELEKAL